MNELTRDDQNVVPMKNMYNKVILVGVFTSVTLHTVTH